jgi:hypothetical protein
VTKLEQEITQLEKSFQSVLMTEIISHRQKVGAGVVGIYLEAIKRHHSRYQEKIRNLRDQHLGHAPACLLDLTERNINCMVRREIERTSDMSTIEFEKI